MRDLSSFLCHDLQICLKSAVERDYVPSDLPLVFTVISLIPSELEVDDAGDERGLSCVSSETRGIMEDTDRTA